jgi:hypothetical protein
MRYGWDGIATAALSHTVLQPANTLATQTAAQPR